MDGFKFAARLVALTSLALAFAPGAATAQGSGIVAGSLICNGSGGVGAVIGSRHRLACTFEPVGGHAPRQRYTATITRVGLDVGITGPTRLIWSVVGPTNNLHGGALAGNFVGVGANASLGVGGGGNALVGGLRNSIILQPVSAQVQKGLNVAAGVAGLRLTYLGH
jgi:hypothetical protein